jgi:hypothetical protein
MKSTSIIISILLTLIGCETVITIDLPEEDTKFSVTSILDPDSTFSAYLFGSSFILDELNYDQIKNATITIKNTSDGEINSLEYSNLLEKYVSTQKPELGEEYELTVAGEGIETATSTIMLPNNDIIISDLDYNLEKTEYIWGDMAEHNISFNLKDSPEKNYYEIVVLSKNEIYSNDTLISVNTEELYVNTNAGVLFEEYADLLIIDDELFNNQTKKISFYFSPSWNNANCFRASEVLPNCYIVKTDILNVRAINAEYFKFYQTLGLQSVLSGDPSAEPVNVYSNIENGFGVFAGYKNHYFSDSTGYRVL